MHDYLGGEKMTTDARATKIIKDIKEEKELIWEKYKHKKQRLLEMEGVNFISILKNH